MAAATGKSHTRRSRLDPAWIVFGAAATGWLIYSSLTGTHEAGGATFEHEKPSPPHLAALLPFIGILLSIAILPLQSRTAHWWESNRRKLVAALGLAGTTVAYYFAAYGPARVQQVLEHAVVDEYIPFIVLLFSLYVISGGISLKGNLAAHPWTNTVFLGIGTVIASFVGTTGASMLLIRPLLQTNAERKRVAHTVVFFIFLVSNVGGCLLPIGDPPLFLGYLRGVPFLWTFRLWAAWATLSAVLLATYLLWDTYAYRHETRRDIRRDERVHMPLRLSGTLNLLWLLGVVAAVGVIRPGEPLPLVGVTAFPFLRELVMLGLAGLSVLLTSKKVRQDNRFTYHAILEVAALFIGIFITMQPPIEILQAGGKALESVLSSPARFFWATGALSSFLDNAPTYAVFFETALSMTPEGAARALRLIDGRLIDESLLVAISLGAVFMGANTYIGNGPNFMVKSIAEQAGVRMPGFFGYMAYSLGVLIPMFLVITWLFL
jgi:Na+/H+ antiporter NhaD/arsenite permease-like protein